MALDSKEAEFIQESVSGKRGRETDWSQGDQPRQLDEKSVATRAFPAWLYINP